VLLEPGLITLNAVSATSDSSSASGLNLRFVTLVPLGFAHVSLMLGTSFAPLGLSNGRQADNDPVFFFGAHVPVLRSEKTDGWVDLAFPVLGSYHRDATAQGPRSYVTDLVLESAVSLHLGRKLMGDLGRFWSGLSLYVLADQNLSPGRDSATGTRDRFNPVFQYGVSIPLTGGGAR
jgi:hypothetical protein